MISKTNVCLLSSDNPSRTGVPSAFATIVTANDPHELGRCSLTPSFSIWFTHFSMTSCARGLVRYGGLSTGCVPGWSGNIASAILQRPSSCDVRENTDLYLTHKSSTSLHCSSKNVVSTNALLSASLRFVHVCASDCTLLSVFSGTACTGVMYPKRVIRFRHTRLLDRLAIVRPRSYLPLTNGKPCGLRLFVEILSGRRALVSLQL